MNEETHQRLMSIKRSFRLRMNGVAAQSMKDKGVEYKINWGVPLSELKSQAKDLGKDYELAIELWKEDIRECKILATMTMPVDRMLPDLTELWMEQTPSQEIAEIAAMSLYQYLSYAPVLAFKWIATDKLLYQICGYSILSRLFMNGEEMNDRGINEFLDEVRSALLSDNISLKKSAATCLRRFAEISDEYALVARNATKSLNLELF